MIIVKAFQCEFCRRKVGMNKTHIGEHEKKCFKNPNTKSCQTCGNFGIERETVYDPHHGGDPGSSDYDIDVKYCKLSDTNKSFERISNCAKWIPLDPQPPRA